MKLDAFLLNDGPFEIRPAPVERDWMEVTSQRYAYRCLPLNIANSHGWEILCPSGFTTVWSGNPGKEDIHVQADPGTTASGVSHFGNGVLTFSVPALFCTEPGYDLMVQGPINRPKDGIYALSGLVETDWLPFSFTMNWMFTRFGTAIRFEKGEPFCHVFPVRRGEIESAIPRLKPLAADPDLKARYDGWSTSRETFNADLAKGDADAVKEGWQKHYYKGQDSSGQPSAVPGHRTRIRLNDFERSD